VGFHTINKKASTWLAFFIVFDSRGSRPRIAFLLFSLQIGFPEVSLFPAEAAFVFLSSDADLSPAL